MTINAVDSILHDYSKYGIVTSSGAKPGTTGENGKAADPALEDSAEISDLAKELAEESGLDEVNATKSAEQAKYASTESRDAEGARLDALFNEMREKYGEEEAVKKFNEYMKSEGYEIDYSAQKPGIGSASKEKPYNMLSGIRQIGTPSYNWLKSGVFNLGTGQRFDDVTSTGWAYVASNRASDNFIIASTVKAHRESGKTTYEAETWAQYDASVNKDISDVLEMWRNRNVAELTQKAGFDVAEYLDKYTSKAKTWGKAFAAESVNADLASAVNAVLEKAGLGLQAGQNLSLVLDENAGGTFGGLNVNLNFGDAETRTRIQAALDQAVRDDPNFLAAFQAENRSVKEYDVGTLAGSFDNGLQSSAYVQQRMFLLSGDQPSVMVMGSGLDNVSQGYVYRKKLSDSYDPDSDLKKISGTARIGQDVIEGWAKTKQMIDEAGYDT